MFKVDPGIAKDYPIIHKYLSTQIQKDVLTNTKIPSLPGLRPSARPGSIQVSETLLVVLWLYVSSGSSLSRDPEVIIAAKPYIWLDGREENIYQRGGLLLYHIHQPPLVAFV